MKWWMVKLRSPEDGGGGVVESMESAEAANPDGEVLPSDLTGAEGQLREGEGKEAGEVAQAASSPSQGSGHGDRGAEAGGQGSEEEKTEDGEGGADPQYPTPDPQPDETLAALIEAYKGLPGVVPAMIGGKSVGEVKGSLEAARKAYAVVKSDLLREAQAGIPAARGGGSGEAMPATPFGKIAAGVELANGKR